MPTDTTGNLNESQHFQFGREQRTLSQYLPDAIVESAELGDQLHRSLAAAQNAVDLLHGLRRALELLPVEPLASAALVIPRVANASSVCQ